MGKYDPLGSFLRSQTAEEVPMSFDEIERVIGASLPNARKYPAWWSNNPFNNVMTRTWLEAGFRTERVDVPGRRVVFRRHAGVAAPSASEADPRVQPARHPLVGALAGLMSIPDGVDVTSPADPDWAETADRIAV